MQFKDLNIIEPILTALSKEGYTHPTPIQEQAIPFALASKDILGCAQTGTGKTAAFSIPILQHLSNNLSNSKGNRPIKALILTPTRELAIQIEESLKAYGKNLPLKHLVIFGGVGQQSQTDALRRGVDILVATPGRLIDLINQQYIHLNHVEYFVLDEADRMLDMGFIHDVKKIIGKLPQKRQTLFFSATMPSEIQKLADSILYKPIKVEVTPVSSTAEKIEQEIYFVDKPNKKHLLVHVIDELNIKHALIFSRTKHGADRVARDLNKSGIKADSIHGDKSQNARQKALNNFKDRKINALVATDIAARGIDIDDLQHVINFDIPNVPETYVHRIGRTGRAGASGKSISFCDAEEKAFVRDIEKLIGLKIQTNTSHPWPIKQSVEEIKRHQAEAKEKHKKQKPSHNRNSPKSNKSTRSK
jgi:ATP-dependent RNA helicase RhlE